MATTRNTPTKATPQRHTLKEGEVVISKEKLASLERTLQEMESKEAEYLEAIADLETRLGAHRSRIQDVSDAEMAVTSILVRHKMAEQNLIVSRVITTLKYGRTKFVDERKHAAHEAKKVSLDAEVALSNAQELSDGFVNAVKLAVN